MLIILIRTLIVYFSLILTMRLMGKRQIGELEVTDLVTTLLLSEIASLPITNREIPVAYAIIPMVTLLTLEICSSVILVRLPRLRSLVSSRPSVIIRDGVLDQRTLAGLRISIDELMSEVRQQGLSDLAQVECAILEKNGKLTVLPKPAFSPPTAKDLGLNPPRDGLMHVVFRNGSISREGLELIKKDRRWLESELKKKNLHLDELFCVMANEDGRLYWIDREKEELCAH